MIGPGEAASAAASQIAGSDKKGAGRDSALLGEYGKKNPAESV